MAQSERFVAGDEIHPIDIVESVAAHHDWEFDRLADDQIAMVVAGQWRNYSLTLAWSPRESVLRLICTFDMDPPAARLPLIYETINLANDQVWDGGFTFWSQQRLMVWRYGLVLAGDTFASPEQIDQMIGNALIACERFYPSFQLVGWGNTDPTAALDIAMGEAYGRA
ncbi:YbjN domain-containing protein [Paracoccus fistulariae]|uniref:YbjN domain-containing protein n=1 Tax=Paracoccus fistulariae TaxID=658446 RepID=A0ABY7SJ67_9RHOB|nr:YbjN domain-containing protein [Paracoccus fistulariae]MDB6180825.1 YbjN domain-containing protein [Paracoccus fistulariae]WCR06955.1 YbjN domain-containing protein [Paracoccus fistulariae]